MKIVVVGGVAGGMSFAARARRLCESCEIVVFEKGPYVSFANCGLPYYLSGEIEDRNSLLLQTPESLKSALNIDVRINSAVNKIDRTSCQVEIHNNATGEIYHEPYDHLVLATGAVAFNPPFPGSDEDGVYNLRTVPDVDAIMDKLKSNSMSANRAVVVGAGFIGTEAAEAFRLRGMDVTMVELADQVLPPLDPEMARSIQLELETNNIEVSLGTSISSVVRNAECLEVELSSGEKVAADLVVVAIGVRCASQLAKDAGLDLDERGGIITDDHLLTSDPKIYAVGDVIEVINGVDGQPSLVPLAGPANRQGRAAANHLFGRDGSRSTVIATAIVRAFGKVAGTVGHSEKTLKAKGIEYKVVHLHPAHHAGYFPGAEQMHLKVIFSLEGRVLGAQAVGGQGVDKRIDVLATAIKANMNVSDLAELELAYAPPFGSAKDPINVAGFIAENVLAGDLDTWSSMSDLGDSDVIVDVRTRSEFAQGHLGGAINIPHTELRDRISEVPPNRPVKVYCAAGFRSYLATRILKQSGWDDVRSLNGGMQTFVLKNYGQKLER